MSTDGDSLKRIVVLISGGGSNLQAIIDGCANGAIHGRIVGVISNRPGVFGLERAQQAAIPTQVIDHHAYADRAAFDTALLAAIDKIGTNNTRPPDLVVLAGFMRILTEDFVRHYHGRMLNIHPSLLPNYKGTHTHQRALADQATEHGVSVHFVTPELDGGPVIQQARVPVLRDDSVETLAARVLVEEHRLYPQVIDWFCRDQLRLTAEGKVLMTA